MSVGGVESGSVASSGSQFFDDGPEGDDLARHGRGSLTAGNGGSPAKVRTVLHSHLKDMAIDALEMSKARDQQSISLSIGSVLPSFNQQPEMAEILASMVMAAYSLAQDCRDESILYQAYSCFSDAQLARIIGLARTS